MNEAKVSFKEIEEENGLNYYFKQKWNLFVTLFCLFSFVTMGLHLELSGSTMVMLSAQVGTDMVHISWIVAARSFGFLITIILCGILLQSVVKHYSAAMLAVGYLLPMLATVCTPYLKSLWALCLALLCQGMLQGISDLAVNILITTMWSTRSTAPLNCVYFGYALGALLSIVLVRIFANTPHIINNDTLISNFTNTVRTPVFQPQLIAPYTIASVFCLISAIGFAFIAYRERRYQKKHKRAAKIRILQSVVKEEINIEVKPRRLFNKVKLWETCSPATCGQGYITYGFLLISLILLYNFAFGGVEQGFTKFFYAFIEQQQNDNNKIGALSAMTMYWLSMLIGRILCTFLTAVWISPHLMLAISWFLCLLTYLLWLVFIWYVGLSRWPVFLLVFASGFAVSSISPTTIGWVKQYLTLSPVELTLILSSNAAGGIVFGLVCGHVFQYYGSKHLFTVLMFAVLSCFVFFLLAFICERIHRRREQKHVNTHEEFETEKVKSAEEMTLEKFLKEVDEDEEE